MTYFEFLLRFLIPPILILSLVAWWDVRQGRSLPTELRASSPLAVLLAHIVVAVLYTTPWDNYLVATRVWWYEPSLVSGIILGWVPLEEYLFFVLQTILTTLWLWFLAKRLPALPPLASKATSIRLISTGVCALIWLGALLTLFVGWRPGTYLGLELAWALFPVLIQLSFGADILWQHRRLVFWSLMPVTIYLCLADFLAIGLGTWIIAPDQSVGIGVGHLPLEEIVFFLATNVLIVFGTVLVLARQSHLRAPTVLTRWLQQGGSQASV